MNFLLSQVSFSQWGVGLLILFGSIFLIAMAFIVVASKFYVKVGPDEAIVKTGMGGMAVVIDGGALIWPVIHRYEKMDLTLKSFEIAREGSEGLICKDNIRADMPSGSNPWIQRSLRLDPPPRQERWKINSWKSATRSSCSSRPCRSSTSKTSRSEPPSSIESVIAWPR